MATKISKELNLSLVIVAVGQILNIGECDEIVINFIGKSSVSIMIQPEDFRAAIAAYIFQKEKE